MNVTNLRPKSRSKFRIYLGKLFYTAKRRCEWAFDDKVYSKKKMDSLFPHQVFQHQTILMRQLKDVDMWYQHNKVINLQLAVSKLSGIVIQPGETFSYWKLIGKPTRRKGYVEGMVLFYGTFTKGIGGGLCQLSNLLYWATLHTPLTVTERHRHSFDVFPDSHRTQPFGSGATCSYNYLDLQIKNETTEPYQLHLQVTETHLIGEWRAPAKPIYHYSVYEKQHVITPAYWGGYIRHNTIYRKKYNLQNQLVDDEYITENHGIMMYDPLLEKGSV